MITGQEQRGGLMLTEHDIETISDHGIPEAEARRQMDLFRRPPPYVELARPCTLGDGILSLDEEGLSVSASGPSARKSPGG